MKIICMIPARIGSKRIKKKNLRLIDNKPLITYVIEKAKKIKFFDSIYLNSDSEIFENIAKEHSIKFYKRKKSLARDKSTNDEFTLDFLNNVDCDIIIQLLPTSPLISTKEINEFCKYMINNKLDTLISVEDKQIACVFKSKPINFIKLLPNPPSQKMLPVKTYATVLMAWNKVNFINNMKKYNSAYHGGQGKTDYFTLEGLSTLDIDNEIDFQLVERIVMSNISNKKLKKRYYRNEKKN